MAVSGDMVVGQDLVRGEGLLLASAERGQGCC